MSYILEALKKLEQKRRREEGPRLLTDQHSITPPMKRPLWPYLLFCALILNAGLLFLWLSPWRHVNEVVGTRVTIGESSRPGTFSAGDEGQRSGAVFPAPSAKMPKGRSAGIETTDETIPEANVAEAEQHFAGQPLPRERVNTQRQHPIDIGELPPELAQKLPDLTISGHFFDADPLSRIVIIGGRTLHEGQTFAPNLKLDQITRDGAIFSYQGMRFRKGVF